MNAYQYAMLLIYLWIIRNAVRLIVELNIEYNIGFCPKHLRWEYGS